MPPNDFQGINGLNTRTLNVSRDQIMAAATALKGRYLLTQDDPELVAAARKAGMLTIYRQSGDENEALHQNPEQFVLDRAAKGGDYVHLTNELGSSANLHQWTRRALEAATAHGAKAVCYNYATHTRASDWEAARENLTYAVTNGHAIGVHVYLDGINDATAFDWRAIKHELGGLWLVTEFGYIANFADPYKGWKHGLNSSQSRLSAFAEKHMKAFTDEQMPLLWFAFDDWPANEEGRNHGFGLWQATDFLTGLAALNQTHKASEPLAAVMAFVVPVPQDPLQPGIVKSTVTKWVNVRAEPRVSAEKIAELRPEDPVSYHPQPLEGGEYAVGEHTGTLWYALAKGWAAADLLTVVPASYELPPQIVLTGTFTNKDLINAIFAAAHAAGEFDGWQWVEQAGMATFAADSSAVYSGPELASIGGLTEAQKASIIGFLRSIAPATVTNDSAKLEVPWISQIDAGGRGNMDCGQACVLMLLHFHNQRTDLKLEDIALKVDPENDGTSVKDLVSLAKLYDLSLQQIAPFLEVGQIRQIIADGHPVILLVDYKSLNFPDHLNGVDQGKHWLLAVGYDQDQYLVHDPLWTTASHGGAFRTISPETLRSAMLATNLNLTGLSKAQEP